MFTKRIAKVAEPFILGFFFGLIPIVAFFIVTVLFASIFFGKEVIGPWTLWSLPPGMLIDMLFLKRWTENAYIMSARVICAIYIFYSICAIGFFMGIPIGNIFLGILAGIYAARKMHFIKANQQRVNQYFKNTAKFTAIIMVFVCCLTTLLAVVGKMIGYRFETPFLSFTFTMPVFFAIVLIGGIFLVLLQYYLTRMSIKIMYERLNRDTV